MPMKLGIDSALTYKFDATDVTEEANEQAVHVTFEDIATKFGLKQCNLIVEYDDNTRMELRFDRETLYKIARGYAINYELAAQMQKEEAQ